MLLDACGDEGVKMNNMATDWIQKKKAERSNQQNTYVRMDEKAVVH